LAFTAAAALVAAAAPAGSFAQPAPSPSTAPATSPSAAPTAAPPAVPAPPVPSAAPPGAPAPAPAQPAPKARFSDATAYMGAPALPVTVAMVAAGGGSGGFDSTKLVAVLAGDKTQAEVGSLKQKFGADGVKSFLNVFTFVVDQSLRYVYGAKITLPSPSPDPKDGKALAAALYKLGVTPSGRFDVEYMLDGLVSHDIHLRVMDDIDAKYGAAADQNYHAVLTQAMMDLKAVYGL
jgi:hypothetical protein